MKRRRWVIGLLAGAVAVAVLTTLVVVFWRVTEVRGLVTAEGSPLPDAVVRAKTTPLETRTDAQGRFILSKVPPGFGVPVTAWKDGLYIGGATAWPWKSTIEISLRHYWTTDSADYAWVLPAVPDRPAIQAFLIQSGLSIGAKVSFKRVFLPLSARVKLGCADCHGSTIYKEWEGSAHAQSASNVRFLTMYNGTDVHGNKSPDTRYGFDRDYGRFPLGPDPNQPYYGPGFKLDSPDQAGICATCHAPTAALGNPYATDINLVKGIDALGVHCDFCHKVQNVQTNPATQVPYENTSGVLSMELRRPGGEPQIFFGPLDDVDVGPDTYLPLVSESRYCAVCHNASFWGTLVYQSYAEWLASPYPQEGKTCQSCHMKPNGITTNFAPGRGGQERDPQTIFTHAFPGGSDVQLLQSTARLELSARREGDRILLEVRVTNENAGHDIPTDQPMRNMLLVVSASDAQGRGLESRGNQVVPEWGGVGNKPNDYAGRPGKGYAKILEEVWTGVSPTAAYWNKTVVREDTRIPARATDTTRYEFIAPASGQSVAIEVKLVFRPAFKQLAEQKSWDVPDILMEEARLTLP